MAASRKASVKRASATKSAARVASESSPKTTRPDPISRREPERPVSAAQTIGQRLDAYPDRIDIRDWYYRPRLQALPDQVVNCDRVPEILDQGQEGACTGFALAASINYLLHQRGSKLRVSPRMLYELARRYDDWPGEDYEGSSARGAMKAWVRHGVCSRTSWPDSKTGPYHLEESIAQESLRAPGGAYYRVKHREVRDMHAALNEVGILYVTLMVHSGWGKPGPEIVTVKYVDDGGKKRRLDLPVIARKGRADGGHAVAIVGYTEQGFIIQNSWGDSWGNRGFALLPYEDYMLHATDVWVSQLGVPVTTDLWLKGAADTTKGMQRAARVIPLNEVRPYVVDVQNNGELSDRGSYWTTEQDLQRLFSETIPQAVAGWQKPRIMLYLHGGLNSEEASARRIIGLRDVFLANQIYPLHIMWETDFLESIKNCIKDKFTDADELAGGRFLDGLTEAKDKVLELTVAWFGTKMWSEMKENARLASNHRSGKGAMQLIFNRVSEAKQKLAPKDAKKWELHVVGHSAGSIFAAHALTHLNKLGVTFKTLQFLAPAIRVDEFKSLVLPEVLAGNCPHPSLYLLSDVGERDDDVGPYGKSLLYLVSNAFEGRRETPLLGMERFIREDAELAKLFSKQVDGMPSLIVAGASNQPGSVSRSESHGGFDNDPDTLNSVMQRILGKAPARAFDVRDLQF